MHIDHAFKMSKKQSSVIIRRPQTMFVGVVALHYQCVENIVPQLPQHSHIVLSILNHKFSNFCVCLQKKNK